MFSTLFRIHFRGLFVLFGELCLGRQGITLDQICGRGRLLFGVRAL